MVQLNPYPNCNGQCEMVFKSYEQCLDGKVVDMWTAGYYQKP